MPALYREEKDLLYLRQFFVQRDMRRAGVDRQCMKILFEEVWPHKTSALLLVFWLKALEIYPDLNQTAGPDSTCS